MSLSTIYGRFEPHYLPAGSSIDHVPSRLPEVLSDDELPEFTRPPIEADKQIRLISLLPPKGQPGPDSLDPLRCGIEVHAVAEAPPFEALSYTWGGIHLHLPMTVVSRGRDGEEVEEMLLTSPQLQMALRRLRGATPRLLWVDQLCINQDPSKENQEKGPQIQLMGDIYRKADRVIIWLGEDDWWHFPMQKDADYITDLVDALGEGSATGEEDIERAGALIDFQLSYHYEWPALRRARAVRRMLNRPWFRRAWVFQEASLAKELVVQFGQRQFDFEKLKNMLGSINAVAHRRGQHIATDSLENGTGGYEMVAIIQRTRLQTLESSKTDAGGFLVKLLQVLRRVECWDLRDLIFAFLAFQDGEGIVATGGATKKPVEEIWRLAAERIVCTSGTLDIFAAAHGDQSQRPLPSWVPNWSKPFPFSRPIALAGSGFRASRDMAHVWAPSEDPSKLRVRGKVIDEIQKVVSRLSPHFTFWKHSVWLSTGFDLIRQDANAYLYTNDAVRAKLGTYIDIKKQNLPRDLTRTVLADGALGAQQRLRNVHEYVKFFQQDVGDRVANLRGAPAQGRSEEETALVADYERVEELVRVAEGKFVFFTAHLQLGMTSHAAKVGDVIAILHGSKTPCVLRKVEDGGEKDYKIISQCYLNGWMYGESPREVYGKDPTKHPHPHGRWWEEEPDEFVLL